MHPISGEGVPYIRSGRVPHFMSGGTPNLMSRRVPHFMYGGTPYVRSGRVPHFMSGGTPYIRSGRVPQITHYMSVLGKTDPWMKVRDITSAFTRVV